MEIERINNFFYDKQGFHQKSSRPRYLKKNNIRKPIDAVSFDSFITDSDLQKKRDCLMLSEYIKSLSDEEVNRKIQNYRKSCSDMESVIVEKLIMLDL